MKKRILTDVLYDYALYLIIGMLLLVTIAMEPFFVRLPNVTTILTQSATEIIYAYGVTGTIVLSGTDLALRCEVGLAAVIMASLLQAADYSQRIFSLDTVPALSLIVSLLLVMAILAVILLR